MEITDKGVCVEGFKASGIKKGKYGLSIIQSRCEANCAVMMTSNKIQASPLIVSTDHAKKGVVRGIVANSGNANAYTGKAGIEDSKRMCQLAAEKTGLKVEDFIVASTGIIGRRLDMETIEIMIGEVSKNLEYSKEASLVAAKGIMTTDTRAKMISVKTKLDSGKDIEIGGIAKGAGMIAPDLVHATMLCFITTNAYIPRENIDESLKRAVDDSFNMLNIDNDMSTNDMVVLLANGLAGNQDVDEKFQEALDFVALEIAKMIAKDGEGATKYFEVNVKGASTKRDAKKAAKAVAGSNLVKTAIFGRNPNWGRIIAAVGYSGAEINPDEITLSMEADNESVGLIEKGKILAFPDTEGLRLAKEILKKGELRIAIDLNMGDEEATAFGCDLSPEYVKINAEYST
ncbi:MAG: bifunctional ornithine acetyltransferase/N-acetylglutamate synthase [Candidatus Hydrothermarchaeales archaeon]